MADLRSNFEHTLTTVRRLPFELRWARYWSMVLQALESAPESLEQLNRLIVEQEEHIAGAEGRPTISDMLGAERAQLRREADEAVQQLVGPFFESDGSPAERAALAEERRRIRQEINPHAERADPPDAYETYVLVLDYATAFATASASAFRKPASSAPPPPPRPAPPPEHVRRPPPQSAREQQRPPAPRPPQHHPESGRSRPERRPQPEPPQAEPGPPQARPDVLRGEPSQPIPERREQEQRALSRVEPAQVKPVKLSAPSNPNKAEKRGGMRGAIIAAVLVVCLVGAAGAGYVLKPEWFEAIIPSGTTTSSDDPTPAVETAEAPQAQEPEPPAAPTEPVAQAEPEAPAQPEPQPEPEPEKPKEPRPPSPLDKFHTQIMSTQVTKCAVPADITKSNWSEIKAFADCADVAGVEMVGTFRFMLSRGGGRWQGSGAWSAPEGLGKELLTEAWQHIVETRNAWAQSLTALVSGYGASFFGFQSHGLTGWRFAAWRCRCNVKGEFIASDTTNVKPRLFITPPAEINSEDEARLAYLQVRQYFLGPEAQGDATAVERAMKNVQLPHGLPGGLGMARPLESQEAAQKAFEEVVALHAGIGFEVNALQWASQ